MFCSVLWVFFKQQNCSHSIIVFEHVCIQELRYEGQWRRYDFQGSDHFILLCENTSNPPEVLSCYKRFICYTPPAKLVTGSTFHALFFLMSQVSSGFSTKDQCWQTCISVLLVMFMWSLCPTAENSPSTKLRRTETWQVQHWWKEDQRKSRGEGSQSGRSKDG